MLMHGCARAVYVNMTQDVQFETLNNINSIYDVCSQLTFVSDRKVLQAELLVWDRVFDKVLLSEGHEVPHVVTQVVHRVPRLYFARSSTPRRIVFP